MFIDDSYKEDFDNEIKEQTTRLWLIKEAKQNWPSICEEVSSCVEKANTFFELRHSTDFIFDEISTIMSHSYSTYDTPRIFCSVSFNLASISYEDCLVLPTNTEIESYELNAFSNIITGSHGNTKLMRVWRYEKEIVKENYSICIQIDFDKVVQMPEDDIDLLKSIGKIITRTEMASLC